MSTAPSAAPARDWDALAAALGSALGADSRLSREEPLGPRTTLRVGGAARLFLNPADPTALATALRFLRAAGVPFLPLGRGSNLLVPDEGVDGVVIALEGPAGSAFTPGGDGTVWTGAGLRLKHLCGLATKAGLVGFEFLEGIPGTVGGALRMNAGAMGGWMFDRVEEVELMSLEGEIARLPRAAFHVDYRQCRELRDAIALGARLRAGATAAAPAEDIARQIDVYRRKRQESQPREASAGCMFKNPPGDSAGRLIDQCGLKGLREGAAEVSPVHANFIVNHGGATATEVLALVRRVRAAVRAQKGVELQPEVLLFGQRWEEHL